MEFPVADLPAGSLRAVTLPGGDRVCVANVAGDVYAFADECPHAAFPLSAGELLADGTVLCAWHGARFDARTGAVVAGPAPSGVATYQVTIRGDTILVGGPTGSAGRGA
jgi:nitrite reductase/ring-hydroxylating ferredoxin subunit